jgi:hypothetical protein
VLLFITGLSTGLILGFSVAAWALYEPVHTDPAKYTFNHALGPVPPYTLDGSKKLLRIECISESEKDCPQATTIPEPGVISLMAIGLVGMGVKKFRNRGGTSS